MTASGPRSATSYSRNDIQYMEHVEGSGAEMYEAVCKLGLEGIVSKRVDAPYRSGRASSFLSIRKQPAMTMFDKQQKFQTPDWFVKVLPLFGLFVQDRIRRRTLCYWRALQTWKVA